MDPLFFKSTIIFALIGFLYASIAWYLATRTQNNTWQFLGRLSYGLSSLLIVLSFIFLVFLIVTHRFEFHYVYSYSSLDLPTNYLVSTFWAGQEGSFLLWILFQSLLGIVVIFKSSHYEPYVMAIYSLVMVLLVSMIAGLSFGPVDIGSSPFKTIYEAFPGQIPVDFIPPDGRGLNPLLQNYWMTIHPPILFTGFAATLVPFVFAIAALWRGLYDDWIKPVMPWMIWTALSLGVGIMLGGYWAYETLGWGGYWAWDPVENGSLVPWLAIVAAFHTVLVQRKTKALKRFTLFASLFAFIMVVYSTFLTRSGVLADFSVHSFVGLGLYGQLLFFILFLTVGSLLLFLYRWKKIPVVKLKNEFYTREFAMIAGSLILIFLAVFVIIGTSLPIVSPWFNSEAADAILLDPSGYNRVAFPLAILLGLLIGIGQLLWYNRSHAKNLWQNLVIPASMAILLTLIMAATGVQSFGLLLLLASANFAIFANLAILIRIIGGNPKLAGGAIAHIGVGLMLIGFVYSGSFDEVNSFALPLNETATVYDYELTFKGDTVNQGWDAFLIEGSYKNNPFTLKPIMYFSDYMQSWMRVPDIKSTVGNDFYVAAVVRQEAQEENPSRSFSLTRGDEQAVGKYAVEFVDIKPVNVPDAKVAVVIQLLLKTDNSVIELEPIFAITANNEILSYPVRTKDGLVVYINRIDPGTGKVDITVEGQTNLVNIQTEKDVLIVEASIKPLIIFVWIGAGITALGFLLSMIRRSRSAHV